MKVKELDLFFYAFYFQAQRFYYYLLFCSLFLPYNQAEGWIGEKLQVANDESHRDPTNLENKLQKHQEFEAEVNANEQRIQNIAQVIQNAR